MTTLNYIKQVLLKVESIYVKIHIFKRIFDFKWTQSEKSWFGFVKDFKTLDEQTG